jgi:hypothetical protein
LCSSAFYYKPPLSSHFQLPPLLQMFLSLPFFPLHSSPSLLSVLTSCIRQTGKGPVTAQHLVCFISNMPHHPLIILCTKTTPSILLSPAAVLIISQLSLLIFSLLHPPSSSSQLSYSLFSLLHPPYYCLWQTYRWYLNSFFSLLPSSLLPSSFPFFPHLFASPLSFF